MEQGIQDRHKKTTAFEILYMHQTRIPKSPIKKQAQNKHFFAFFFSPIDIQIHKLVGSLSLCFMVSGSQSNTCPKQSNSPNIVWKKILIAVMLKTQENVFQALRLNLAKK